MMMEKMFEIRKIKGYEEIKKNYQKTIQLFLTEKCNLNCGFCFRKKFNYKISDMPFEFAKKIILDNKDQKNKISFTGGEPALYSKIEELLDLCSKLKIDSEIYTNGTIHFNNSETIVKLRYDGFDIGSKLMKNKIYHGNYQLGLLINGDNKDQLLKCILQSEKDIRFSGVIQLTEIFGKNDLPICGVENYISEVNSILKFVSENIKTIKQIEISVGCLGKDLSPRCRFQRYFGESLSGLCPRNKSGTECKACYFQKQVFVKKGV